LLYPNYLENLSNYVGVGEIKMKRKTGKQIPFNSKTMEQMAAIGARYENMFATSRLSSIAAQIQDSNAKIAAQMAASGLSKPMERMAAIGAQYENMFATSGLSSIATQIQESTARIAAQIDASGLSKTMEQMAAIGARYENMFATSGLSSIAAQIQESTARIAAQIDASGLSKTMEQMAAIGAQYENMFATSGLSSTVAQIQESSARIAAQMDLYCEYENKTVEFNDADIAQCNEILIASSENASNLVEYLDNLQSQLAKLRNSDIAKLLVFLFLVQFQIFYFHFQLYYGKVFEQAFAPEIEQDSRQLRNLSVSAGIISLPKPNDYWDNCRLVREPVVLRENASTDSPKIGELPAGAIVYVQEVSTHWARIEWHSENGSSSVKGWAARNRLSKFIGTIKK